MDRCDLLIVGGGLSGLSAAWTLGNRLRTLLLEAAPIVGGLSATQHVEGYLFDWTGHWLHLRDQELQAHLEGLLPLARVTRKAAVFFAGSYLPYPFQSHTAYLPQKERDYCLDTFKTRPRDLPNSNYEEVLLSKFGEGIYELFLKPYNTKLWGLSPKEMSGEYAVKYIPDPDEAALLHGGTHRIPSRIGYNQTFLYPSKGGMGALAQALAAELPPGVLRVQTPLTALHWSQHIAHTPTGPIQYGNLLFTAPLPSLGTLLEPLPPEIATALSQLRGRRLHFLDLGLRGTPDQDFHWCYVPEPHYPFYRVGIFSTVLPSMAPPNCSSLYVELTTSTPKSAREELALCLPGLRKMGLIPSLESVQVCRLRTIEGAYAIPDHAYLPARNFLFPFLRAHDIHCVGRFGRWSYSSMGEDMRAAMERVRAMQYHGL